MQGFKCVSGRASFDSAQDRLLARRMRKNCKAKKSSCLEYKQELVPRAGLPSAPLRINFSPGGYLISFGHKKTLISFLKSGLYLGPDTKYVIAKIINIDKYININYNVIYIDLLDSINYGICSTNVLPNCK
jgi:hypothetical protein